MAARTRKKLLGTQVVVKVLVSFNGLRAGDIASTERDATVEGWVDACLVEILEVDDGEDPTGPSSPEPDVQEPGEA